MNPLQPPSTAVYRSVAHGHCVERLIVLRMAGIPAEIVSSAGEHALVVESSHAEAARRELERYHEENREPAIRESAPLPVRRSGAIAGGMIYGSVLLLVYALEQSRAFGLDWTGAGLADASLIRQGEWWRAVTALFLHGDAAHLGGNVILGALFGVLAGHRFGPGPAWCGILAAGVLGNAVNALVRWSPHLSIGASTAVFGALGILAAHTWASRPTPGQRALVRWAPVVSGVVLLSLLGTGGERTDVVAHVTGFGSGVLLGALFARMSEERLLQAAFQRALAGIALGLPILAWTVALVLASG